MIAGIVGVGPTGLADRAVRALSAAVGAATPRWHGPGAPWAWLAGALSASGQVAARPIGAGSAVVALEGRVYDLGRVRSTGGDAATVAPGTPADRIAALWPAEGCALLDRLVGDFALAAWDSWRRELVLAAEPLGQSPMYYAASPDRTMLAFASRTNLLRAIDWVDATPDDDAVVSVLVNEAPPPDRSFFRTIRQLPGGHRLRWRDGRVDVARYWDPRHAGPDVRSVDEMIEAFEHTVRAAVAARLDPDRPTAILMSGGYDSTAVAGAAAAIRRERGNAAPPVVAVSATFDDLPCDESTRIDIALADNGLPGHRVRPTGRGISVASMRRDVARHDAPFVDLQAPFLDDCLSVARDHGCRTVMTGLGGDELTTDFDYQLDFARAMGPWRFPATVRRVAAIERRSALATALWLARQLCPETLKRPYRQLRRVVSPGAGPRHDVEWLEPDARRTALCLCGEPAPPPVGPGSATAEIRWRTVTNPIVESMRRWFAVETAARGFTLANPLLDRRLFELVLGTDARCHPRSSDRGDYKPLIACGLPFAPRRLVTGYWKAEFGSYNAHVLNHSLHAIEDWLFGTREWRAERFVSRETAMHALSRFRDEPQRLHYRLETIVGLETWLRGLGERTIATEHVT